MVSEDAVWMMQELIQLFVDDGGTAADEFEEMMKKLRVIFVRVRERGLSLSASKTELFATEAVFAGALVGRDGVKPDRTKLTAIVNWKTPSDAMELARFLGLASWFRDLIKGYAAEEKPRKLMTGFKLEGRWGAEQQKAFARLKAILTSEPVLREPKFDGSNFIVTSDGCQDAFGAVLAQRFTTVLQDREKIQIVLARVRCAQVRARQVFGYCVGVSGRGGDGLPGVMRHADS